MVDVRELPWRDLDGPSLVASAAGLQLIQPNIHRLLRLQRLAAIGAAVPINTHARPLTPTVLRSLLRQPAITAVAHLEDPYEDIYVTEVTFHGGPHRVLQGLTSRSAHMLQTLLTAVFLSPEVVLPAPYLSDVYTLCTALLKLSDLLCERAGLKRGMTASASHGDNVYVPRSDVLDHTRSAVTFSWSALSAELTSAEMSALENLAVRAGTHPLDLVDASDNGLIARPLLLAGPNLIVSNPGELASSLRYHILSMAVGYDCKDELVGLFRSTVAELTANLLSRLGVDAIQPVAQTVHRYLLRRRFRGPDGIEYDVGIMTDNLDDYDPTDPFGEWRDPNIGINVQDILDPDGEPTEIDKNTLRLLVSASLGRHVQYGLGDTRRPGPLLMVTLEELEVMIDLDGADPLFLWYFAQANERLHRTSRVLEFSKLDTYAIYRDNDHSFYLSDDRPASFISIDTSGGGHLRHEASRRIDRHYVRHPFDPKYLEVTSVYGTEVGPIYEPHPRHGLWARLLELPETLIWILPDAVEGQLAHQLVLNLAEASTYWLWQIWSHMASTTIGAIQAGELLRVTCGLDDAQGWEDRLNGLNLTDSRDATEAAAGQTWVSIDAPAGGPLRITAHYSGAQRLLMSGNGADRELVEILVEALLPSNIDPSIVDATIDALTSNPSKRIITVFRADDVVIRPSSAPIRRIEPPVTDSVLDELGRWMSANNFVEGKISSSQRVPALGKVVSYYFNELKSRVAELSSVGLMEFLIAQDEAIVRSSALRQHMLSSRLACFGPESILAKDLQEDENRDTHAAVASRFIIEYVAATPPAGSSPVSLREYDYLMALAGELISRATLSDAIHYGFSSVELAMLPSGRLGVSIGDRYGAATRDLSRVESEARHALALGPATRADNAAAVNGRGATATDLSIDLIDSAMEAEFGFSLTDLGRIVGELVTVSDTGGTDPCVMELDTVRDHLQSTLGWSRERVENVIAHLSLSPRDEFLSRGPDVYPWRYNRDLSYIRRPLVQLRNPSGSLDLCWGTKRIWSTLQYWGGLITSARLKAHSSAMRQLMGSIRQNENREFERKVAATLNSAGMPIVASSVKTIAGRRLIGANGEDLGDIDAISIDPTRRIIVVAEAKDFELARTPAELSNESKDLLSGETSAVYKLQRRARWIGNNQILTLAHFGIHVATPGWKIVQVVVTSRDLLSPRISPGTTPVVSLRNLPAWTRALQNKKGRARMARRNA